MDTRSPENLYAPPAADVSSGASAQVPPSLLRRYVFVVLPGALVALLAAMFLLTPGGGVASWALRALSLVALWWLPVMLIMRPFAREAGGLRHVPMRLRMTVLLTYPLAVALAWVLFAVIVLIALTLYDAMISRY